MTFQKMNKEVNPTAIHQTAPDPATSSRYCTSHQIDRLVGRVAYRPSCEIMVGGGGTGIIKVVLMQHAACSGSVQLQACDNARKRLCPPAGGGLNNS